MTLEYFTAQIKAIADRYAELTKITARVDPDYRLDRPVAEWLKEYHVFFDQVAGDYLR